MPRQSADQRRPAIGDRLQLAVSVELITEQVAEQHRPRVQLGGDPVQPELIDLEQPQLTVRCVAPRPAASSRVEATPPAMLAPARL